MTYKRDINVETTKRRGAYGKSYFLLFVECHVKNAAKLPMFMDVASLTTRASNSFS